ncbi:MAG: hypothetical protein K940chlam3_01563 [Chlamydiae bacterium]|nr:hypothetical protein [Chlamydiota bacterium]
MEASTENLIKHLKDKGFNAELQSETGQVYFIFKEKEQEFPLFFRFFESGELLQMIAFFPIQMNSEVISDVSRLLHLLNKELDIPGFGLDEIGGVTFFRIMLDLKDNQIDETLLEKYINTARLACKTFGTTIEAVVVGATTVDEMIKKAQDTVKGMETK